MKCKNCHRNPPDALLLENDKCVWCDGEYHKLKKEIGMDRLKKEEILHDMKRISQTLKILKKEDLEENRITLIELLEEELDRLYGDIDEM